VCIFLCCTFVRLRPPPWTRRAGLLESPTVFRLLQPPSLASTGSRVCAATAVRTTSAAVEWTALGPSRVTAPFSAFGLLQFVLRTVDTMRMTHRLGVLWSLAAATALTDLVEHWLPTRRVRWCATPPSPTPLRHHSRPAPLSNRNIPCYSRQLQATPLSLAETAETVAAGRIGDRFSAVMAPTVDTMHSLWAWRVCKSNGRQEKTWCASTQNNHGISMYSIPIAQHTSVRERPPR